MTRDLGITPEFVSFGDLVARERAALVEAAGTDSVGVCLDTRNPATMVEGPLLTLEGTTGPAG